MRAARYPDGGIYFHVYYRLEEGQWIITAVRRAGESYESNPDRRVTVSAVDELGAFQKVSKWLERSNAEMANMARSSSTSVGSGVVIQTGGWSAST